MWVGMVPSVAGRRGWAASDPASASTSTMGTRRPSHMHAASVRLNQGVSAASPAKAEPLLFEAEA